MALRWKDLKQRAVRLLGEFKGQTIGLVGLGIIIVILLAGIFAPLIAPETNGEWNNAERWQDLPRSAPPVWMDYVTTKGMAHHEVVPSPSDNSTEGDAIETATISYTYDYQDDLPPKDVIMYLHGSIANETPVRQILIQVERPDGKVIDLLSETLKSNGTLGSGGDGLRYSLIRNSDIRSRLYTFGKNHMEESNDTVGSVDAKYPQILFGKANNNILSFNPDPLTGEYPFNVTIRSQDIDIDFGEEKSRMIFAGRVYGLMGTDSSGRDIARAWTWGARYALILGAVVASTTVVIGTLYGMTSAYFGGWVDEIMQRVNEIVIGIPITPILIIMMFIWRQSFWVMIFLMSILYWRGIAKTIRARGLQIRQSTYVEAAESLGSGSGRIITTHMVPQILPYSVAEAALLVPIVIITEASLSVLGLGDPNLVTWGKLLSQANSAGATVQGLWWWVLLPGIGITLLGFAFISTGMAIERVVNPKMKQR